MHELTAQYLIRGVVAMAAAMAPVACVSRTAHDGQPAAPAPESEQAWRSLIDERLSQWSDPLGSDTAWHVENDTIVAAEGAGEWLATNDRFADFELVLEFSLGPGANSGVGICAHDSGDPRYGGYEIQLVNSQGEAPSLRNGGAVFDIRAASVMAMRPPETWNSLRVRLQGDVLNVWLNESPIHADVTLPPTALRDPFAATDDGGRLSLQHSGRGVQFREIRVRDLSPERPSVFSVDGDNEARRSLGQ